MTEQQVFPHDHYVFAEIVEHATLSNTLDIDIMSDGPGTLLQWALCDNESLMSQQYTVTVKGADSIVHVRIFPGMTSCNMFVLGTEAAVRKLLAASSAEQ